MVIHVEHVNLSLAGTPILSDINLTLDKGQMIGLIGPNGAGKTSLLKVLANLLPGFTGQYQLHHQSIRQYSTKELSRTIGYLAQDAEAHWPLKVKTLIELGRLPYQGLFKQLGKEDQKAIDQAIEQTEIAHLTDRIITEISGGEKARVLLARVLAANPSVILLDEPIAALDPYHQLHIMEILKQLSANGCTIIIILHDINLAARFCDQLVLMEKGKIVKTGNIKQVLDDGLLEKTYGIHLKLFCEDDSFSLTPWSRMNKPS